MLKLEGKVAIFCKDKGEYGRLAKAIISTEYSLCKWFSNNDYFIISGDRMSTHTTDKTWLQNSGYKIITLNEFLEETDLKVGDKFVRNEDIRFISNGFSYDKNKVYEIIDTTDSHITIRGKKYTQSLQKSDIPELLTKITFINKDKPISTMTTDNLPEKWAVLNDDSRLFKDTVIKWMNKVYGDNYWNGTDRNIYYGYNSNYKSDKGTFCRKVVDKDVIILTIQEFINLTTEKPLTNQVTNFNNNNNEQSKGKSIQVCPIVGQIKRGKRIIGTPTEGKTSQTSITSRSISYRGISS